jgi:hypothetical protein
MSGKGNILKKLISLLILLALTLTALIVMPPPNAKADAAEARILTYSYYTAPSNVPTIASSIGDLIVVGELQNVGSNIINNVTVQGTAYSNATQVLATSQSEAFVYEMAPGAKAPFYIDFTAQSGSTGDLTWTSQVNRVTVTVTAVTDTTIPPYVGIKMISDPINSLYDPTTGTYTVTGTIQNNGTQDLAKVWAAVTFYDASGTVVGVNFTHYLMPYPSLLQPGGYTFFDSVPSDCNTQLGSKISTFNVIIDSQPASQTIPTNSPTPTATATTTSNAGFPTLAVIVLVVLVVAAVIGVMLFRKQKRTPPPPPPPPPPPE